MLRKLAIVVTAAVSQAAVAMPAGVMAFGHGGGGHGGGGGGHGGFGGGFGGHGFGGGLGGHGVGGFSSGRSFSGPGAFSHPGTFSHPVPGGGAFVSRVPGHQFISPGATAHPSLNHNMPVASLAGRHVIRGGRIAWIGHHRVHGRHIYGFIPGIGYGYYWYYDDCYVWTDYGWIDMCGYTYPY